MIARLDRIALDDLALVRGDRVLFAGLSRTVEAGAVLELTGPNGSGKTSLLRALAGLLRPAAGRIRYLKGDAALEDPAVHLHLLGHRDGLKPPLSVAAHGRYWAGLLGGNAADVARALDAVGLTPLASLPARVLSQGQGRRLALSRLLIAPRPVWLLDEPAAGLDTAGKAMLANLITDHAARGGLVIAAVHESLGVASHALALGDTP